MDIDPDSYHLSFNYWKAVADKDLQQGIKANSPRALKISKLVSKLLLMGFEDIQYNNFGVAYLDKGYYTIYKVDKSGNIDGSIVKLRPTDCRITRHFIMASNLEVNKQYIFIKRHSQNMMEGFKQEDSYAQCEEAALSRVIKVYTGKSEAIIGHNGKIIDLHTNDKVNVNICPDELTVRKATDECYQILAVDMAGNVGTIGLYDGNLSKITIADWQRKCNEKGIIGYVE